MQQTFTDVACTVCGCVCDDLQLDVADNAIVRARGTCRLSEPWFAALSKPNDRPAALVAGKPVSLAEGIDRAVDLLRGSRAPLVWGLERSSTDGQRAAIALAEQIGGTIDTPSSCDAATVLAIQDVGQSTCTLGEVRNRADLVVFWGADPLVTHSRHLERYSVEPRGVFLPQGRADRTVVVVDTDETETGRAADVFVKIRPEDEFEAIESLRKIVGGNESAASELPLGLLEQLRRLAAQMKGCQYGALFFVIGQHDISVRQQTAEALLKLTRELCKFTRFTAHHLGRSGGLKGAENVLTWQTGFPFAVNFAQGYPTFDPQKFSAEGLLERGEVDACVLVGSESVGRLSIAAQHRLRQVPTIALDYPNVEPAMSATVQFTTAIYGIHAAGTAYRMDGIAIPLRQILNTDLPTDHYVLNEIAARLKV